MHDRQGKYHDPICLWNSAGRILHAGMVPKDIGWTNGEGFRSTARPDQQKIECLKDRSFFGISSTSKWLTYNEAKPRPKCNTWNKRALMVRYGVSQEERKFFDLGPGSIITNKFKEDCNMHLAVMNCITTRHLSEVNNLDMTLLLLAEGKIWYQDVRWSLRGARLIVKLEEKPLFCATVCLGSTIFLCFGQRLKYVNPLEMT